MGNFHGVLFVCVSLFCQKSHNTYQPIMENKGDIVIRFPREKIINDSVLNDWIYLRFLGVQSNGCLRVGGFLSPGFPCICSLSCPLWFCPEGLPAFSCLGYVSTFPSLPHSPSTLRQTYLPTPFHHLWVYILYFLVHFLDNINEFLNNSLSFLTSQSICVLLLLPLFMKFLTKR